MAWLPCSVRVVQLRIEIRMWIEKIDDQLMSTCGKLQRGMTGSSPLYRLSICLGVPFCAG